jgi:hypothetical protein
MPIAAGPPVARCFPRSPGRLTFHLPTVFETLGALVHALSQYRQSAEFCPCPKLWGPGATSQLRLPSRGERVWSPCGDGDRCETNRAVFGGVVEHKGQKRAKTPS